MPDAPGFELELRCEAVRVAMELTRGGEDHSAGTLSRELRVAVDHERSPAVEVARKERRTRCLSRVGRFRH
jgi:hypothetical protein